MRALDRTELAPGGIPGDPHFAPGSARQLLLIEAETLQDLRLRPGQVRENLTVAGLALMGLPEGSRLRLGRAEVEITKECLPCSRMDDIRPGLQEDLRGCRGMLAKVVVAGTVCLGDGVTALGPTAATA